MHPRTDPRGSPFADALDALGLAASATVRLLQPARSGGHIVAALTGALTGALMLATAPLPAR